MHCWLYLATTVKLLPVAAVVQTSPGAPPDEHAVTASSVPAVVEPPGTFTHRVGSNTETIWEPAETAFNVHCCVVVPLQVDWIADVPEISRHLPLFWAMSETGPCKRAPVVAVPSADGSPDAQPAWLAARITRTAEVHHKTEFCFIAAIIRLDSRITNGSLHEDVLT
jgi:hypothetical protein